MLLNFFTNGRLNVSILKIGKKFKTASFIKKFIGFSNQKQNFCSCSVFNIKLKLFNSWANVF